MTPRLLARLVLAAMVAGWFAYLIVIAASQ